MPKDELIAALEKATGPDAEIDARIWCYLNGKKYLGHNTPYGEREGRFVQVEYTSPPKRVREVTNFPNRPHALCVTASIDAALTLRPEGALYAIETYDDHGVYPEHVRASAWVQGAARAFAATPALAIVIAALRAAERGEAGR